MKRKIWLSVFILSCICLNKGFSQKQCPGVTNMLHAGTPWVSVINLNLSQTSVTFYTNWVCGATSYTWVVDGLYHITTTTPSLTMSAWSFLWYPPTGCTGFNSKLTLYPLQDIGVYSTTLAVKSDVTEFISIPVMIDGVEKCRETADKPKSFIGPN